MCKYSILFSKYNWKFQLDNKQGRWIEQGLVLLPLSTIILVKLVYPCKYFISDIKSKEKKKRQEEKSHLSLIQFNKYLYTGLLHSTHTNILNSFDSCSSIWQNSTSNKNFSLFSLPTTEQSVPFILRL